MIAYTVVERLLIGGGIVTFLGVLFALALCNVASDADDRLMEGATQAETNGHEVRAYIMSGPVAIGRIGDVSLAALGATPAQACARMAAAGRQLVVNAERAAHQWRTTKRTIAMKQALAAIS